VYAGPKVRAHLGHVLWRVFLADDVHGVRTVREAVRRVLYVDFVQIFCANALTDGVVVTCIPQKEVA
jgi:hypothetical protein